MSHWPAAIAFTISQETGDDPTGGYTFDPSDPGGETRWGISRQAHPDVDVKLLTREQAQRIYYDGYWKPLRAAEMPFPIALALFDWAVHSGNLVAAKRLQRCLGVEETGNVKDKTVAAANAVANPVRLACDYIAMRSRQHGRLIQNDPKLARFAGGWSARLVELMYRCTEAP